MSHLEELQREIDQEGNIEEFSDDADIAPARYDITSYGIDFDIEGIVRRVKKGDIYIPEFQRNFVWKMPESSRFIESLLLGLPVPGIFLAQDPETNKMLVIDGQQRLLSLKFFYDGYFNPKEGAKSKRIFKLAKVQEPYNKLTYEDSFMPIVCKFRGHKPYQPDANWEPNKWACKRCHNYIDYNPRKEKLKRLDKIKK